MKNVTKLGLLLMTAFAMFSCGAGGGFTLNGKIDGTQATEAVLAYGEVMDTVVVEEGVFKFEGDVEEPVMATLLIEGRQTNIMLENSEITIEGAVDAMVEAAITGSESQLAFDEFIKEIGKHQTSREDYIGFCTEFCENNADAYFTPYVIGSIASMLQPQEAMDLVAALSPEVQNTKIATELKEQLQKVLALSEGGKVPDFTMNDQDGKPVKLSDVYKKNKYTLIDFWASWCAPCRQENPNVVANFKKYNEKGFGIIGVSLDKEKDAWIKAIADDELTWVHVSDLQGWKNAAAAEYAVRSIPASFLVDSEGKIMGRNLREAALGSKLSELLD